LQIQRQTHPLKQLTNIAHAHNNTYPSSSHHTPFHNAEGSWHLMKERHALRHQFAVQPKVNLTLT
jgi:hypothetical protein